MTLPISRISLGSEARPLRVGMQGRDPRKDLVIKPVNQCFKFPYFIKGIPPKWKNAPPSVKLFKPFDDLKFRLKLRMFDKQRRKLRMK